MSQKVLITGGTGFVGSNLVKRMVSEGFEVHILTRKTSDRWRIQDVLKSVNEHHVDLLDQSKLEQNMKRIEPDIIFHLATLGVYGGIHAPEKVVIENNLFGTINLINACDGIDYKCFINTGSSSEYGPKAVSMKESDVCEPINAYGISKCASTLYGSFVAKTKDRPIMNFRLFSPFGPFDDNRRLIPYVISTALQNKPFKLAKSCSVRDYIYIKDILDLYVKGISLAKNHKGEIFNLGRGTSVRVSDVVDKVLELTSSSSVVEWNTFCGRDHDCERWEANIEKICHDFKWRPLYDMDKGLEETIAWFKNNPQYVKEKYLC